MNSGFKKDLILQIHQHKAVFLEDRFLDSVDKSFLNQTWHDLRKKMKFLKLRFACIHNSQQDAAWLTLFFLPPHGFHCIDSYIS